MKPPLHPIAGAHRVGSTIALAALLAASGCHSKRTEPKPDGPMRLEVPAQGAYTGAFIDFGDYEDQVRLEQIEDFEHLVGKHQAIVASSSYWGEQTFPTANLNLIWRHGSIPLVFWSPWERPYQEDMGPDKFSLIAICDGKWDAYIDRWGDAARAFGHPIMVSFANEMNGSWFPWSGYFYGAGATVPSGSPSPLKAGETPKPARYQGPETYKRAYRHVVDRVRSRGASNVIWVFHAMNYSGPQDSWNLVAEYYPGSDYVDWLGYSVYGQQYADDSWSPFLPLIDWPYKELCALDPDKPLMLTEWGVGEYPNRGSKAAFIAGAFDVIRTKLPRVKAAIYWQERWQNEDGSYSNLRVNSDPDSLAAYRRGVGSAFWADRPLLTPLPSPGASNRSVR